MARGFDVGEPTLQVKVYEDGELVERIPCESMEDAAGVVASREEQTGVACVIEDLAVRHSPTDVLAPEPEDAM